MTEARKQGKVSLAATFKRKQPTTDRYKIPVLPNQRLSQSDSISSLDNQHSPLSPSHPLTPSQDSNSDLFRSFTVTPIMPASHNHSITTATQDRRPKLFHNNQQQPLNILTPSQLINREQQKTKSYVFSKSTSRCQSENSAPLQYYAQNTTFMFVDQPVKQIRLKKSLSYKPHHNRNRTTAESNEQPLQLRCENQQYFRSSKGEQSQSFTQAFLKNRKVNLEMPYSNRQTAKTCTSSFGYPPLPRKAETPNASYEQQSLRSTVGGGYAISSNMKEEIVKWKKMKSPNKFSESKCSNTTEPNGLRDSIGLDSPNGFRQRINGGGVSKLYSSSHSYSGSAMKRNNSFTNLQKISSYNEHTLKTSQINLHHSGRQQLNVDQFQLGLPKAEGKCKYGQQVFPARDSKTGMVFALKKIKKRNLKDKLDIFISEVKIQMMVQDPSVVKIYAIFDDKDHIYLLSEYMEEGSLYTYMKMNKNLPENQIFAKISQIGHSLKAIQSYSLIHRSIKPQNICLTHNVCKLDEFSEATICKDRRISYCGTRGYTSPEIICGESYDNSIDVWCLGVIAYEMITGKPPFYNLTRKDSKKKLVPRQVTIGPNLSFEGKQLIDKMLKIDPYQRLKIEQVLNDALLTQGQNKYSAFECEFASIW